MTDLGQKTLILVPRGFGHFFFSLTFRFQKCSRLLHKPGFTEIVAFSLKVPKLSPK